LYPQLLDSVQVTALLHEARQTETWANIFNRNSQRSVAAAGVVGQDVALKSHHFLIEDTSEYEDDPQVTFRTSATYGFCVTPRLWKAEELLCIAIALLDPKLHFTGINQEDGIDSKTAYQGMALLHPRVQRIFYKRLHAYSFVNPRHHPINLQRFSSVVINGGGLAAGPSSGAPLSFLAASEFSLPPFLRFRVLLRPPPSPRLRPWPRLHLP
jgi:hypothetical protein